MMNSEDNHYCHFEAKSGRNNEKMATQRHLKEIMCTLLPMSQGVINGYNYPRQKAFEEEKKKNGSIKVLQETAKALKIKLSRTTQKKGSIAGIKMKI